MENTESQSSELLTQNAELMTQNELTQLGDDDMALSPLPPQSPLNPQSIPWGRLIPCSRHLLQEGEQRGGIDLLPVGPGKQESGVAVGVSFLGLNVHSGDVFNEYVLGRSHKCDVIAAKLPQDEETIGKDAAALHDWAHAMISNRHCRIYCMLSTDNSRGNNKQDMQVYIEDTSGNGTLINNTTLLRRGEKRLLHTGDEISLVNPATLSKKIRSTDMLRDLQRHHSFIFVNVFAQQQHSILDTIRQRQSNSMRPPSSVKQVRKGLVDVRALNNHSILGKQHQQRVSKDSLSPRLSASRQASPRPRRVEQEYDIRDVLGSGTCGEVRRAIHRRTGEQRAVKIIPLGGRNRAFYEASTAFQAEASILQALDHPYVVKLVDVFVSPGHAVYLVMELLHGGDLFDRIIQRGRFTEDSSRRVMRRLLNAMFYLHEIKNVVHRDLKPENILCVTRDNDVDVKLTDFGLAKNVTEDGLKTFCGTPQYFAPEVLRRRHTIAGRGRYGKEADCWSLGVILYILLSGTPPFDASLGLDCVVDAKIRFPTDKWHSISDQAKDLVQKLLMADPTQRISVKDACKHVWIMVDDGDTHTYPLDDPVVPLVLGEGKRGGQSVLSSRKLFSQEESSAESPSMAPKIVELGDTKKEVSTRTFEEDQKCQVNVQISSGSADESISDGTIHTSNATKSDESALTKPAVSIATTETQNSQCKTMYAPNVLLPSLTIASSNLSQSYDRGNANAQSMDASNTNGEKLTVSDTPAAEKSIQVPLSLNARSNNFRDLVVKNAGASNITGIPSRLEVSDATGSSQKISPEEKRSSRGNLVTPRTVETVKVVHNRLSRDTTKLERKNVEQKTTKPKTKKSSRKVKLGSVESRAAELSEDEICSQFSDEEGQDSISSFGTNESDAKDSKSSSKRAATSSDAQPQKRKKRRIVFGQIRRNEDTGAPNRISQMKGKPTKAKATTKKSKSSKDSKNEMTGCRQTTLSNFFRKAT